MLSLAIVIVGPKAVREVMTEGGERRRRRKKEVPWSLEIFFFVPGGKVSGAGGGCIKVTAPGGDR